MLRYKEIKLMLLQKISNMSPLDRLPSRLTLCKELDTTRSTLDKAIKELEGEGILFCRDGSGTYVAAPAGYDRRKPENWGIIVPDINESIYAELVRGVEDVAQEMNVNLILCNFDHDPRKQEQYIRRLILTGVAGVIIVPVLRKDNNEARQLYSILTDTERPIVFCNMQVEGVQAPVVMSNGFFGGYLATRHLIEQGYRHIAYLAKYRYRTSEERCQGYLTALLESGLEVNRHLITLDGEESDPPGYLGMKALLKNGGPLDAVFCFNDSLMEGAYRALKEAGLRISDDVGVIGYDNTSICQRLKPEADSVSYPSAAIGQAAARLLKKIISGATISEFPYYLFQPEIVERASCLGPKKSFYQPDGCETDKNMFEEERT